MAANSSIILSKLDFDSNRESLKAYLKEQDAFKDYDFESSNLSVLLDILSYNTYLNAFYLNMVGNEMFLDSAQLRDSVVSHAKELNYLPRSFASARARINISVTSTDASRKSLVIPKGTPFLSRIGDNNYTFTTNENIVIASSNNIFTASDVTIYEGNYLSDTYAVNYANPLIFKITNRNVDISSLSVLVIEDNGSTQIEYSRATSLFDLDSESTVFFIQPSTSDSYEIVFGDGVIGRKPKNNSIVVIEYRSCNGELPNGANKFISAGRIDGEAAVTVGTNQAAYGGAVAETLESIKYNAPRAFTTQERAVTAEDYENLLKINFAEINAVSAYGGEDATPPQYGRIFISVDLKDVDGLPRVKQQEYTRFLRGRASVALEPIFVSPDYVYLGINSTVKYNINKTGLNPEDIRTLVISSMLNYASTNLNNFNRTLRYSRFIRDIDEAEKSIVSNETEVVLIKYLTPSLNINQNITVDFRTPLIDEIPKKADEHPVIDTMGVYSTPFTYQGQQNCALEDDGDGRMHIVATSGNVHRVVQHVGTVDYDTGIVNLNNFNISSFNGTSLKMFATPRNKDIASSQNVILNILEPDINITIEQIRE